MQLFFCQKSWLFLQLCSVVLGFAWSSRIVGRNVIEAEYDFAWSGQWTESNSSWSGFLHTSYSSTLCSSCSSWNYGTEFTNDLKWNFDLELLGVQNNEPKNA
jgi:hypothetical protein